MNMKANKMAATTYNQLFIHPFHMTDVQFKITDKCKKRSEEKKKLLLRYVQNFKRTQCMQQKDKMKHVTSVECKIAR